jgi:rod shape-determining protein MreD
MRPLVFTAIGVVTLWLQLTVAPLVSVFGYKPNLLLLTVAVMGLRWGERWLFIYAALAGLSMDVFSHDVLGIYAISFFACSFLARLIGVSVYENSLLVGAMAVFAVSLAEGLISTSLFQILDNSVPWWSWMFTEVLPGSLVNGLWSPLVFIVLTRLERWARPVEA